MSKCLKCACTPHAHTAIYKAMLSAYASQTRNSISTPKPKTTFTQQSHRHSMPHILAPHAYTATNKVLLCAYATEARNSISIPKSKTHIYAVTTQAIHAAHTCPAHTVNTHHRK